MPTVKMTAKLVNGREIDRMIVFSAFYKLFIYFFLYNFFFRQRSDQMIRSAIILYIYDQNNDHKTIYFENNDHNLFEFSRETPTGMLRYGLFFMGNGIK